MKKNRQEEARGAAVDPRAAAWTADDSARGRVEGACSLLERLASYLDEAHAEEIEGDHAGDADHEGPAPESCSYCEAAATARALVARLNRLADAAERWTAEDYYTDAPECERGVAKLQKSVERLVRAVRS